VIRQTLKDNSVVQTHVQVSYQPWMTRTRTDVRINAVSSVEMASLIQMKNAMLMKTIVFLDAKLRKGMSASIMLLDLCIVSLFVETDFRLKMKLVILTLILYLMFMSVMIAEKCLMDGSVMLMKIQWNHSVINVEIIESTNMTLKFTLKKNVTMETL